MDYIVPSFQAGVTKMKFLQPQPVVLCQNKETEDNFEFSIKTLCCGYLLEASHWDDSNQYPQHMQK